MVTAPTVRRPAPRAGILDIGAHVPGLSAVPPGVRPVRAYGLPDHLRITAEARRRAAAALRDSVGGPARG